MRDLRAVIHGITTAVLCGMAVFSCSTISKAAGETYQTAVEAAYGDTGAGTKNKLVSTVSTRQAGGSCFPVPTFP